MKQLLIITPVITDTDLYPMYYSIVKAMKNNTDFQVQWVIQFPFEGSREATKWQESFKSNIESKLHISVLTHTNGVVYSELDLLNSFFDILENQINGSLSSIDQNAWVYVLKTDTMLHPDLIPFLCDNYSKLLSFECMLFAQCNHITEVTHQPNGTIIQEGATDLSTFIFRALMISPSTNVPLVTRSLSRFEEKYMFPESVFIDNLVNKIPLTYTFVTDKPLSILKSTQALCQ